MYYIISIIMYELVVWNKRLDRIVLDIAVRHNYMEIVNDTVLWMKSAILQ